MGCYDLGTQLLLWEGLVLICSCLPSLTYAVCFPVGLIWEFNSRPCCRVTSTCAARRWDARGAAEVRIGLVSQHSRIVTINSFGGCVLVAQGFLSSQSAHPEAALQAPPYLPRQSIPMHGFLSQCFPILCEVKDSIFTQPIHNLFLEKIEIPVHTKNKQ